MLFDNLRFLFIILSAFSVLKGETIITKYSSLPPLTLSQYNLIDRDPRHENSNYVLSMHPLSFQSKVPICLISMPRSGTNFLISVFSYGLSETKRWCGSFIGPPGVFEEALIDANQLEELVKNNRISWCHANGGEGNICLIKQHEVPVILQMRDPR